MVELLKGRIEIISNKISSLKIPFEGVNYDFQ